MAYSLEPVMISIRDRVLFGDFIVRWIMCTLPLCPPVKITSFHAMKRVARIYLG
ncbi:hypothetical protein SLEP1_g46055 [Rubroshorea leprosula]|uniref:Uncharacterized protein n=1 Tax=Rubroshorea leprosula TaxID=152421 RepID=A0AAV5LMK2_9ROSI|nr:hypothetical protein SLEP1_g46055 [Rubroshorea leprosula]